MNFYGDREEKDLIKFIKILVDQYVEDFDDLESHIELRDKLSFCLEELLFWNERENKKRYLDSLQRLLEWLFDKVESNF